jgi:hypothetical protein
MPIAPTTIAAFAPLGNPRRVFVDFICFAIFNSFI